MIQGVLAAVTLNWHDNESTLQCLASLLSQDVPLRVYVVDNESDGTLEVAVRRQFGSQVTVIEARENRGFSGGMNLGLKAAVTDGAWAILAINNDATASPDAVGLMAQDLSEPRTGIVGPQLINLDGSLQSRGCTLRSWGAKAGEAGADERIDFFTWACVLLRTEMLEAVGLLDESFFMYWEDADFGLRLKKTGWRLVFNPRARVTHALSASHSRAGVKIGFYSTIGLQRMARIHGGYWKLWVPYRIFGRLALALLRGDVAYAKAVLEGARFGKKDILTAFTALTGKD